MSAVPFVRNCKDAIFGQCIYGIFIYAANGDGISCMTENIHDYIPFTIVSLLFISNDICSIYLKIFHNILLTRICQSCYNCICVCSIVLIY